MLQDDDDDDNSADEESTGNISSDDEKTSQDFKKCFVRLSKCNALETMISDLHINENSSSPTVEVNNDSLGITPIEEIGENNCDEKEIESSKQTKVVLEIIKNKLEDLKEFDESETENKKLPLNNVLHKKLEDNQSSVDSDEVQTMKVPFITPFKPTEDNKENT